MPTVALEIQAQPNRTQAHWLPSPPGKPSISDLAFSAVVVLFIFDIIIIINMQ